MRNKQKIIIGIDTRDLRVAKTGQKTVTEELCRQFRKNTDPEIDFIFFDSPYRIYTGTNKWRVSWGHIRYQFWKQLMLPFKAWRNRCDVLFCGDYFAPVLHLGYSTVQIFHDAFFFEYPQHYNRPWLKLFHGLAMPAARRCRYIMTPTVYAKQKIHSYTGIPLNKLVTIYPGPKTLHVTAAQQEAALPDHFRFLESKKYILHVGVMEKRKNLPMLIKAFRLLRNQGYTNWHLVFVGQGNGKIFSDDAAQVAAAIRDAKLEDAVHLMGYLPDDQLAAVYHHANLYVFPSINEGFGIPILEAFKFDLPVLVANNSCLPEVGGDAVISFNPYDENDICARIKEVIDNEPLQLSLIEKGRNRLQYFTWEKAAADLVAVFKQACRYEHYQ